MRCVRDAGRDQLETSTSPRFGSRGDLIVGEIKRAILSGRYEAGSPLTEKVIADELGISKTPVREALKSLSGTGLVTSSSHRGTFVRTVDTAMALAVCDLRLLLEPEAVRRTIRRGLDPAALKSAIEPHDRRRGRRGHVRTKPRKPGLSSTLYAGCGNPALVKVLDDLTDVNTLISVTVWNRSAVGPARPWNIARWPRTPLPGGQTHRTSPATAHRGVPATRRRCPGRALRSRRTRPNQSRVMRDGSRMNFEQHRSP